MKPVNLMRRDFTIILGALFAAEWLVPLLPEHRRSLDRVLIGFGLLLWVALSLRRAPPLSQLGIRTGNFSASLATLIAPVAVTFGLYALFGDRRAAELPAARAAAAYFFWALFQQLLAVGIFWRHYRERFDLSDKIGVFSRPNSAVALATALTFSAVHAPNPGLMALTLAGEGLWILFFQRWRNLFALALAHAVAALLASALWVPSPWLPNLQVGLRFLHP